MKEIFNSMIECYNEDKFFRCMVIIFCWLGTFVGSVAVLFFIH